MFATSSLLIDAHGPVAGIPATGPPPAWQLKHNTLLRKSALEKL